MIKNIDSFKVYHSVDYWGFIACLVVHCMDALNYYGLEIKQFGLEKVWNSLSPKVLEPRIYVNI